MKNGKAEQRLFSEAWIERATSPSGPNKRYGYMWWLNKNEASRMEGVNKGLFYDAGFEGNFTVVAVTRWLEPSKLKEFLKLLNKAF